MKARDSKGRLLEALASSFDIFPKSNYQKAYPRKTPQKQMDDAWGRTMGDLNNAIVGYSKRHERAR